MVVEQEIARLSIRVPIRGEYSNISLLFAREGSGSVASLEAVDAPAQSGLDNVFFGERRVNARHASSESLERGRRDSLLLVTGSEDRPRKGGERTSR